MRHLGSLLGLMLCAVSVAGCTSDAAPVPAPRPSLSTPLTSGSPTGPSASPTPTPRETPTETPPPMPAAAKGDGRAAAKAFVRYYIDLINYAGVTGDTAQLRQASATQCVSCRRLIQLFDRTYDRGGYFRTAGWTVRSMLVSPGNRVEIKIVAAEIRTSEVSWRPSHRAPEESAPGETIQYRIELLRSTSMRVTELTRT